MAIRKAQATWKGKLADGSGQVELGSGAFKGSYSFPSRFEQGPGTNPEELIGAAHAGCFSMAFAHSLAESGYNPKSVHTVASVHLDQVQDGFAITSIELETEAEVPDIEQAAFQDIAQAAKTGCPVSKALAGTNISLNARLVK
ncbi:MAG: OsmC family protein [Sedimentisphaerales bacterium]|nr:OsmC family protein [Sedimentisphaerales bacterium]